MAIGQSTFSDLGGAVADLFAGFGAEKAASLKAQGLSLGAEGTRISAEGIRQQAAGLRIKAGGDIAEGQEYDLAARLARQNEDYVRQSTAIQQYQLEREITATIGGAKASAAGSGLKESGSVLDVLADSARQGALAHDVLERQSAITIAGYEEQAKSYDVMSAAAKMAATGETSIADATEGIAGRTIGIASREDLIAEQTLRAGKDQAMGDFVGAAIKGVAGLATLFI